MDHTVEHVSGLRAFLRLRRDPLAWVSEAARTGADVRTLRIGRRHLVQLNHPDLIRDVLITSDWNFVKGRALRASRPVLGHGLLTSEGELHRRQRRLVQPAFHSARLASYSATMVDCAGAARAAWPDGAILAIDREMTRLTLHIVGHTLFSADLAASASEVGSALTQALQLFLELNSPAAQLFPPLRHRAERRAAQLRASIGAVLGRVIEEHRVAPERYDDMLSMLLRSSGPGQDALSDDLLLDEALTLFLAGHETTANALTFTWLLLAQHPEVAANLHAELDRVLAGRLPTLDDVPRLVYTARVFHEALRLYPPAWLITRDAVTACRLGPVSVPAGATVLMSPFAMHRDPRFWPDPERFDPNRWADDVSALRPRFAFFPFGAGTRACIGEHFALMEGVLLLATLAQRWHFHLVPGQQVELWPQITLRPRRPLLVRLEQRLPRRPFLVSAAREPLAFIAP